MGLVEGIRGPDAVRFCDHCQDWPLQQVGAFYNYSYDENGKANKELLEEYSHLPECPVCGGVSSNVHPEAA